VLKGFREFILRGNVVDLAVAVVIGAAFKSVVDAFVADVITPLIAAIFGKPDFSSLSFTINGSRFNYGNLINQVISFLIIAAVIYYLIVVPMNVLAERRARRLAAGEEAAEPEAKAEDILLLEQIRDLLADGRGPHLQKAPQQRP
jgi:large conductance mechanosensitive channel